MAYLQKYEELKQKKSAQTRNVKIPIGKTVSAEFDEVLLYGLRPRDPRIDSMSPWIFVQWWKGKRLPEPDADKLTKWREGWDINSEKKRLQGRISS